MRRVTPRTGRSLGTVLLNLVHLLVWFGCLWLLMRFQWGHALALAAAAWLLMSFVVPAMILPQALKREPAATAWVVPGQVARGA